jgi:hypothetical protein
MFYPVELDPADKSRLQQGLLVLTPAASKRLIAKAVAGLPEVQWAYANGRLSVTNGTTNAYVLEELTGEKVPPYQYAIGMVTDGLLTMSAKEDRVGARFFVKGERVEMDSRDFLKTLEKGDVVIKGGNAVDEHGNAGVLVGNETGGTIGAVFGIACVRGIPIIMPIGLEKLIPSIPDAATGWGQLTLTHAMGLPCWLTPVTTGLVMTEIQALGILAGVRARQVAAGGVGGSEGSVVLLVEGYEENLNKAITIVGAVKGEQSAQVPRHHLS